MIRIVLTLCTIIALISQAEAKTVRVGTLGITNLFTVDGRTGGYAYDYLTDIQSYVDWQYEFMPTYYPDQLERLRRDEVDIVPLVIGSAENRAEFLFPDVPMTHYLTLLCVLPDENGEAELKTPTPRIGVIERYINFDALHGYCEEHGINPTLVYFPNKRELHKAMQEGEIDAAAINSFCYDPREVTIDVLSYDPVYFAINPKREDLLRDINHAQLKIHAISESYEDKLFQAYYEGNIVYNIGLDDKEREFIKEHKKVTVAVIDGFAPVMYWDKVDGKPHGIAIETLETVSTQFKLPMEYVKVETNLQAYEKLMLGEVDLIASHFGTIDSHDALNVVTSKSFFPAIQAQVTEKNFDPSHVEEIVYASDQLTRNLSAQSTNMIVFDTPEEAIEAVYEGRAHAALGAFYVQQNVIDRAKYRNFVCTPSRARGKGISFLIAKNANPSLRSILNKGIIAQTDADMMKVLYRDAIATKSGSVSERLIYEHPVETILVILMITTLLFTSVYFRNRKRMLTIQLEEKEVYETKLQEALDRAERASKAKSDFLARMTHEIRTPINAVLGFNRMLEENPHNEKTSKTWHRKIEVAGEHLLQLVNDVLDISKLNAGQIQLESKEVSLTEMMEQIDIVYSEFAHEKQIELKVEHPVEKYIFMADEVRLKQILINMISNGIKYNHCGGRVGVKVTRLDESSEELRLRFEVEDNGVGIDKKNLEKIFMEFERAESSNEQWIEGLGLGLAISSRLARLMNTRIQVESEVGVGSRFWLDVKFPLVRLESSEVLEEEESPPDCEGRHVLVVEDNEINAELITFILEEMHARVDIAENGKIACEKFEASPEGFYSFVIMDIMMPVMSGYEATEKIRALKRSDARKIPIIALSANAFEEDRAKSIEVGMSNHCAKPIDPSEFYSAIRKAIAA